MAKELALIEKWDTGYLNDFIYSTRQASDRALQSTLNSDFESGILTQTSKGVFTYVSLKFISELNSQVPLEFFSFT